MAGVKISELNKWTLNEIKDVDAAEILIPVSIHATTGALRSSVLVGMLTAYAPEYYTYTAYSTIMYLKDQISALSTSLAGLQRQYTELSTYVNELQAQQHEIDAAQSSIIESHIESISDINAVNIQQDIDITALKDLHNWENYSYSYQNSYQNTETPEPENP